MYYSEKGNELFHLDLYSYTLVDLTLQLIKIRYVIRDIMNLNCSVQYNVIIRGMPRIWKLFPYQEDFCFNTGFYFL
jgi:hypothetical protein